MIIKTICRFKSPQRALHQLKTASQIANKQCELEKIRNIGILAHIDAGKTTTTERMLYYSGLIAEMGEVHEGTTVTDFMVQERERGITISSAAVTFNWKNYRFNLIDTPGHIDFTMGVEQTLTSLDGTVIVLDGSAGVEAQTVTVWRQTDKYNLPRIVYVNKMDRQDANFDMSVKSLESKLDANTFPVHLPYKENSNLVGIINVITLEKIIFDKESQGYVVTKSPLEEGDYFFELAKERRRSLTDKLSGIDDELANFVIEENSLDNVSSQTLVDALRKVTVSGKGVPVLLGSSYKNIGVQTLMDGVILYLPSPNYNQCAKLYDCFDNHLSARVFKILHDKQRGPITYFRVYTGEITKNQKVYNVQRQRTEQIGKLYAAYADDFEEISKVGMGNIGAITGLKYAVTGDLLTTNASSANRAKEKMEKVSKSEDVEKLFSIGSNIPDPVFFCSIEPPSMSYVNALEAALQELEKEDPSLRVTYDSETDQTILAGMGELHLDIIKERIRTEYKIDVDLGELQIAYKETIQNEACYTHEAKHEIGDSTHEVLVKMSLIPNHKNSELLLFDNSQDSASNIAAIHPKIMNAVKKGVTVGLKHGPKLGCPLINVGAKLHWFELKKGTSESIVSATVSQCIRKILEKCDAILLEPIMVLEVVVLEEMSANIISDLIKRRAAISSIDIRGRNKIINCSVPLSGLLGYATALRILSSGNGTFSMEFSHYNQMNPQVEQEAIKRLRGF